MAAEKPNLTPKQEAFARVYVETSNASEAYRQAYDVGKKTLPERIWSDACKLAANPKVAQRVAELHLLAQERTLVTMESITKELDENRKKAEGLDQPAAMNGATMGKAKVNGLLIDKVDVDATFNVVIAKEDADL